jgi:hypothetical protein
MDEKKKFYIPKNFKADWELFPGWGLKEFIFMLPPVALTFPVITYEALPLKFKFFFSVFMIGLPFMMIHLRPKRDNIHVFKHLKWKFDFIKRQTTFYHRKEGWKK